MGKITQVEEKGKNFYNIYVDGEFFLKILKETFFKCNLKVNSEISEQDLLKIIFNANNDICYNTAVNYVSIYYKTSKEIKDYLLKKGFEEETIEIAIQKLKEYNFINDFVYAENFIKYTTGKGEKYIKFQLKNKGVDEKIINELLENRDDSIELENANNMAQKYLKNKEMSDKTIKGLYTNLLGKGFSYGIIKKVCKNIKNFDGAIEE